MALTILLLIAAIVIALCVVLNNISNKIGIPMLLAFILLGMSFGSDGIVKIPFDDFSFTEDICTTALIFIMFYGGFGTRWKEARPVVVKASILSTLGVAMTAGLTGLFCYYVLKMPAAFGFLIGAVLSSTDAASVFSILRSRKLGLKYNTASLLEIESGSNDPCSYMLTVIMMAVIEGTTSGGRIAYMIFAQIAYGAAIGAVIAMATVWLMKHFRSSTAGFDTLFILAVAIFSYAIPNLVGGNGYLSAYIVGIVLGNANIRGKKSLVPFFDGLTNLMQIIIFFLLGLLSFPSQLPSIAIPAILIALFMTIIARPLSVFAIMAPFKSRWRQQVLVSFVGLRGAASVVFAIMAMPAAQQLTGNQHDLFNIVLMIVLLSISLQGSLIPAVARGLKMTSSEEDILKTFTDYSDNMDVSFVQMDISEKDSWNGKVIKDLPIPHDTLVAAILRDGKAIIPSGRTKILPGDKVIMSARDFEDENIMQLSERRIERGSEWIGKKVFQYSPDSNELIVLIKRGNRAIIPRGNTVIHKNDVMVINKIRRESLQTDPAQRQ
ncbi:MAG TPA: potassium/proton antiporter [Candidatus Coprenecus pullistercoris]|nr:potassium/proton antiporter [Candidatus Coprenecus pullistercoris]